MSKYTILKELIMDWRETETQDVMKVNSIGGMMNSYGMGYSQGAIEAYDRVLKDIEELECEVSFPND